VKENWEMRKMFRYILDGLIVLWTILGPVAFRVEAASSQQAASSETGQVNSAPTTARPPARSLYRMSIDGRWGFIDQTGHFVIEPRFDGAWPFSEGLARVEVDGKWGYLDMSGQIVIPPRFENAQDFSEGVAGVMIDDTWGFVNPAGEWIIPPKFKCFVPEYQCVYGFTDGFGFVDTKDGGYYYFDKAGELVFGPFGEAWGFSEGLAPFRKEGALDIGYIDTTGHTVIEPQFDRVDFGSFSEGLTSVEIDHKWGYIDATGNMVIAPQFDYAAGFSEGLANVSIGGKDGFIDRTGKLIIELQFDYAANFSEGLARVGIDGKSGFIDKTGQVVITPHPQLRDPWDFKNGLVWTLIEHDDGEVVLGYLDKTGNIVAMQAMQGDTEILVNGNGDILYRRDAFDTNNSQGGL
jgi:hypothetical protein